MLAAGLTALLALPLYLRTVAPDVAFWDTGEFQTVGTVLGIAHPTGYPTYTLLLWLASVVLQPFGEPALRANLLSVVLVAGGCGLVAACHGCARRTLAGRPRRRRRPGARAGSVVGRPARRPARAAPGFVALLLVLLVAWQRRESAGRNGDRWLIGAAVVFGLALGNHALTLLLAPGIALFLFTAGGLAILQRRRLIVSCALAWG